MFTRQTMTDTIDNINEKQLLCKMQKGEAEASRMVYSQYVRYLSAIAFRYITDEEDVKDVLQESFLKIFSSIGTFVYKGPGSLKGWMARITLNETLKHLKRSNKLNFTEWDDNGIDMPDEEPETEDIPASDIYRMIRALPNGYRTIFNLYVIDGKSHKEIAKLLSIKESSSASQLHRAKALLANKIKQYRNNKCVSI